MGRHAQPRGRARRAQGVLLQAAKIDYRDAAGRVADFHSFRHTFITNLARSGVHPKTAQTLARHSTITLTMDRYTHTLIEDSAKALVGLPDLSLPPVSETAKATGTDGQGEPRKPDRKPSGLSSGLSEQAVKRGISGDSAGNECDADEEEEGEEAVTEAQGGAGDCAQNAQEIQSAFDPGEVPEWPNGTVSKTASHLENRTCIPFPIFRLRQISRSSPASYVRKHVRGFQQA